MKIAIFSTHHYDETSLTRAKDKASLDFHLVFHDAPLNEQTAVLAKDFDAVCVFVNDVVDASVLSQLEMGGTKLVLLRCAGFNNVDRQAAEQLGVTVLRVPAYSPFSVAEFTVGLFLALNRKICQAWLRIRLDNFSLDGLVGHDVHGRTVGVLGTGRIGSLVARAFKLGFGCEVIANDVVQNKELEGFGVKYVSRDELFAKSDVLCLHAPLTPETHHIINERTLALVKPGMILVNTSRGGLLDTSAVISALEKGTLGGLAMDVYEDEASLFFRDRSSMVIKDDKFQRLITFPNVLVTGHQAFFTEEALGAIAQVTLQNAVDFRAGKPNQQMRV